MLEPTRENLLLVTDIYWYRQPDCTKLNMEANGLSLPDTRIRIGGLECCKEVTGASHNGNDHIYDLDRPAAEVLVQLMSVVTEHRFIRVVGEDGPSDDHFLYQREDAVTSMPLTTWYEKHEDTQRKK